MKEINFLIKLKNGNKLKLVEPSDEVKLSYLEKADDSLKSAKILLNNNLYENSVSMSYYGMYNSITALLYKVGIKCKNHTGSILLLKLLFEEEELSKSLLLAKEERIDRQYYTDNKDKLPLNNKNTEDMIKNSENFLIEVKLLIDKIGKDEIKIYRKKFSVLVN